jgi:hypothetical protein
VAPLLLDMAVRLLALAERPSGRAALGDLMGLDLRDDDIEDMSDRLAGFVNTALESAEGVARQLDKGFGGSDNSPDDGRQPR